MYLNSFDKAMSEVFDRFEKRMDKKNKRHNLTREAPRLHTTSTSPTLLELYTELVEKKTLEDQLRLKERIEDENEFKPNHAIHQEIEFVDQKKEDEDLVSPLEETSDNKRFMEDGGYKSKDEGVNANSTPLFKVVSNGKYLIEEEHLVTRESESTSIEESEGADTREVESTNTGESESANTREIEGINIGESDSANARELENVNIKEIESANTKKKRKRNSEFLKKKKEKRKEEEEEEEEEGDIVFISLILNQIKFSS